MSPTLFHPSNRALDRFVDREPTPARDRVAVHLAQCGRCRDAVRFHRELREAAIRVPVPTASEAVLARVLAARADGERLILPVSEPAPRRHWALRAAVLAIALAGGGLAVATILRDVRLSDDLFVSANFLPSQAHAQELPPGPTVPPIAPIDGTRIKPGRVSYESRWIDSTGRVTPDGTGASVLSRDTLDGMPVWRIAHRQSVHADDGGQLRVETETLFVRLRDLHPIARAVHVVPYRQFSQINIRQRFTGDSLTGEMTTDGGVRRVFARRIDPLWGPYLTDALSPFLLAGVPLGPQWRGGGSLLGWAVREYDISIPVALRVTGSESVTTPAGTFDCWKLSIGVGKNTRLYWVRKSDGLGVRVVDPRATPHGIHEILITSR